MSRPKISVIVPIYNNEKYLSDAINSLINQTYENLEIILVDDGSTDKSGEICDSFAKVNENIVVIHQENSGVSKARNTGLKQAQGELIGFCDSDDTVDRDYFEFLYNQMVKSNSDIACCCIDVVTEKNTLLPKTPQGSHIWSSDEFIKLLFLGEISVAVYDKLFRKTAIENLCFSENYKINEDKLFCFYAGLSAQRISYEKAHKYHYYRRLGTAATSQFSEKYYDLLRVAQEIFRVVKDKKPQLTELAQCNIIVGSLILYKLIGQNDAGNTYQEYEKKTYEYIRKFDKSVAKKYLRKYDYLRFSLLRKNKRLFYILTKLFDKN